MKEGAIPDQGNLSHVQPDGEKVPHKPPLATSDFGALTIGGLFLAAVIGLAFTFIYGMVWVAETLKPLVEFSARLGTTVLVFLLLPLSVFKGARRLTGNGIVFVSYLWGIALWMQAVVILYQVWGALGMFLGFVFLAPGAVFLLLVALLFQGAFTAMGAIVLVVILIFSVRAFGRWVASKGHKPTPTFVSYTSDPWD